MHDVWSTRRDEVERQADELTRAIEREVSFIDHLAPFTTRSTSRRRDSVYATSWSSASTMKADSATRRNFRDRATSRRCSSSTTTRRASRSNGPWTRCRDEDLRPSPRRLRSIQRRRRVARATLKRCSATRHCWRGPTSAPPGPCRARRVARGRPGHDQLRAQRPRRGKWFRLGPGRRRRRARRFTRDLDPKEVADALEEDGLHDDLDAVRQRWRIEEPADFEGRSIPRLAEAQPFSTPAALAAALASLRRSRARRIQPGATRKSSWNGTRCSRRLSSKFVTRLTPSAHSLCSSRFSELTFTMACGGEPRVVGRTPVRATLPG